MTATLPQQWFNRASEDLTVARLVFKENHLAHVCFLCQQCIEKSLKAYLLAKTAGYPRTHKLVDLLGECQKLDPDFARFSEDCLTIDQYYIPTRYPNGVPGSSSSGIPDKREAEAALASAEAILQFVSSLLV